MPGRHVTDHQMRLFMKFRQTETIAVAAAKASFSAATAYRIEQDPRLPSAKTETRERRRPDPLSAIFEQEVVPMLAAAPGLRPIAIFEEIDPSPSRTRTWNPPYAGAAHPRLARPAWRRARGDFPPDA